MNDFNKLIDEISKIDVSKITQELIRIPSYSFMENQEKEVAEYIYNLLKNESIECQLIEIEPGRFNVYGKLKGTGGGKSIMLSGHIDTVPQYDMKNPFDGEIREGKIFGRGSCDMKGPVAAMLAVLIGIKRCKISHRGDIFFTGLADEEEQGKGAEYLVKHGPYADAVIMGEPTSMKISLGHKGLEWIEVKIHGKKVHGGSKDIGINAIEMAARFINYIYEKYVPILNEREYPVLGKPTINIGTISGGDQPSTVPGECIITLDRRCVPTETIEQVYNELEEIVQILNREDSTFHADICDVFQNQNLLKHIPFCIAENDDLVRSVKKAMAIVNFDIEVCSFPAWSDAGFISSNCDSKCIVMGPGDISVAHSAGEYIKISDLKVATKIYGYTVLNYTK